MSDRINGFYVALDKDYKDEDVYRIRDAILMIKGVLTANNNVVSISDYVAEERVKSEYFKKLFNMFKAE